MVVEYTKLVQKNKATAIDFFYHNDSSDEIKY